MNDYTDYMVRTYISGSVDDARERTTDANEIALLDYTERYLLDLYASGQMVASFDRDDDIPTLTMAKIDAMQDMGMFTDSGLAATSTTALATTTAKTLRSGVSDGFFEGEQIGIAFNVNENFSVSYSESEETYDEQSDLSSGDTADVSMKMDAMQVAYSMGGMSIKAYKMKIENPFFDEDAEDTNITEIALGLAF